MLHLQHYNKKIYNYIFQSFNSIKNKFNNGKIVIDPSENDNYDQKTYKPDPTMTNGSRSSNGSRSNGELLGNSLDRNSTGDSSYIGGLVF